MLAVPVPNNLCTRFSKSTKESEQQEHTARTADSLVQQADLKGFGVHASIFGTAGVAVGGPGLSCRFTVMADRSSELPTSEGSASV